MATSPPTRHAERRKGASAAWKARWSERGARSPQKARRPAVCRATHVHVIVPGGGLSPDGGRWIACKPGFFLPVRVLSRLFRRLFLGAIAFHNKAAVYDLLFRTAAETLITVAADPKHLGARIGLTAVLHTWGSALTHHPTGLDRRHHLQLAETHMAGVGLAPRRPMGAKDVGDPRAVTRGPRHAAAVRRAAIGSRG